MTYLRNGWYVAALSREVTRAPLRRVLLDEPIVLFRAEDGSPVALTDRCPHRFAPLSRGRLVGDAIECGYHGLRFDRGGACVRNPHGKIPAARVRAYPLTERYGFVWIWPGAAERADAAKLPDLAPFEDARYVSVDGYLRIAANYQLVTDNLLDLSHVEFLHPGFAVENEVTTMRIEVVSDGDTIHSNRWKPNCTVSSFLRMLWQSNDPRGDARANIRWDAPANLFLDVGVTAVGAPIGEGVAAPYAHLLTPETSASTHYFWATARNCRLDDAELSEKIRVMSEQAFENEDEPMIEAQQAAIGVGVDLMELRPILLEPDAAAVRARRVLKRLIEAEANGASLPSPAR